MKHVDYFRERFKQLEEAQHEWGAKAFGEMEKQYREAQKELEAAIDKWYRRFAENNNISMAEARKWLTGKDLKEFRWTVEEYIAYGEEHAVSGRWAKELENASAKYHISRLEALKIQTQQALERLFTSQNKTITDTLSDVFRTGYYRTAFELQKGFEIGFDVGQIDNDYLAKVLAKPWAVDGKNFSERIWNNKEKLINELHSELSRNIITGADPQKAIDAISHKLDVSKANAGRLVMTEEAYFSSMAQKECFEDLDVEEYEIVATLDNRTSEICQEMDGQHFPMKDFEAGVTAPPFHVNCRSTTCPYFNDEFSLGERAARDENGEVYYVPSDMTYPKWKEAFVDGGSKEGPIIDRPEKPGQSLNYPIEKDIIHNIDVDDLKHLTSGDLQDEVIDFIGDTVERLEKENGIYFAYVSNRVINTGKQGTAMFQTQVVAFEKGPVLLQLNINVDAMKGKSLSEINSIFSKTDSTVVDSIEEALIHESSHAQLYSGKTYEQVLEINKELKEIKTKGISPIAEDDGVEALAEIKVLLSRGEEISKENIEFYNKYTGGAK